MEKEKEYLVYGKPNCPFCEKAKALLKNKGIEFSYKDVTADNSIREMLLSLGARSVPQIFQGDVHIGGYEDLAKQLGA